MASSVKSLGALSLRFRCGGLISARAFSSSASDAASASVASASVGDGVDASAPSEDGSIFMSREELLAWRGLKSKSERKKKRVAAKDRDALRADRALMGPTEAKFALRASSGKLRFVAHPDVPIFDGLAAAARIQPRLEDRCLREKSSTTSLDKFIESFPPKSPPSIKERSSAAKARRELQERSYALRRTNAGAFQKRREAFETLEEERLQNQPDKTWKLSCATLLERLPVVLPELSAEEDAYQASLVKRYRDFAGGLDVWGIQRNRDDENPFVGERDPDWIVDVLAHGGAEQAAWYGEKLAEKREYAGITVGSDDASGGNATSAADEAISADYDSDDEVMEAGGGRQGPSIKVFCERTTAFEDDERRRIARSISGFISP